MRIRECNSYSHLGWLLTDRCGGLCNYYLFETFQRTTTTIMASKNGKRRVKKDIEDPFSSSKKKKSPDKSSNKKENNDQIGTASEDEKDAGSKREWYLDWEEYFMTLALVSAQRSKDPEKQVGACIVNKDNRIVGLGYKGMPDRIKDEDLPWGKGEGIEKDKKYYVCHAAMNAIVNKYEANLKGCEMYVTLFPCNECAKIIIQSGIKKVIYYEGPDEESTDKMFELAGVEKEEYKAKGKKVIKIEEDGKIDPLEFAI